MDSASPRGSLERLGRRWGIKPLIAVVSVCWLGFALGASPALATNNCLQDVFKAAGNNQKLNCTANDVSIAEALNPRNLDGSPIATCFAGVPFSFIADFQVVTTATARENIGFYMATGGQSSALTGTCADNIVSPLHSPGENLPPGGDPKNCTQNGGASLCLGSALYHELDTSLAGDNCGDTQSADGTNQFVTIEVDNIVCPAVGTTFTLPNCTSWQQPGGAILCESTPPGTGWPWVKAAIPGSPSKCNCGTVSIPITPISYALTATKVPSPASTPEPGGNFTYTVGVSNTTVAPGIGTSGSEIITQVCDDKYGNIATTGACSGGSNNGNSCASSANCPSGTCVIPNSCPAGTLCSFPNNVAGSTCATGVSCSLPQTVALGATVSDLCSFTGSFMPGTEGSLKDTVTVNGFGNTGTSSPQAVSATAQAIVTVSEAPSSVQTSKSLDTSSECATVRYKIEVDNKSDTSTDESETLSALMDTQYGDITKTGGNVLGTTCGVSTGASGLGTLSTVKGAGSLPISIAPGGSYICKFDGKFCGAANSTVGSCTNTLEQIDTINATITGDEGGESLTGSTSSTLTVDVCFTGTNS